MKAIFLAAVFILVATGASGQGHEGHGGSAPVGTTRIEAPPADLPSWMASRKADHLFYKTAPYNFSVYRIPKLARDLNAVAVGHAMAYEDLVTGKAATLETDTFDRIDWVLNHPPKLMPDEGAISPTFLRLYGYLEKVFDWSHVLHAQTIDVLTDAEMTDDEKDAEIERLWAFYRDSAPFTITGLPMNMEYLWSDPHSQTFRKTYPKVNGLFWGYHWLQTSMYDMLYRTPTNTHIAQYDVVGARYHEIELYKTDREFMPMMGESSPRFSKRFPEMANAFDNLHMLHDMVNDILASDLGSEEKAEQIKRSIWMVLASTHAECKAGTGEPGTLHDHRYPAGMPGMGMMFGSDEDAMYMSGMGWMNMSECGHCSVSLPDGNPWGASVSANGWTMLVRCLLCARDMAAETPGQAIVRASTNDPNQMLVLISDDQGNWTSYIPDVLFLEEFDEHPSCSDWSRAFTTRAAFDAFVAENPEYSGATPLSLAEWAQRNEGTPDTFRRVDRPSPYEPAVADPDAEEK